MILVDLRSKGITGKAAQITLDEIGITANKNTIPFDPEKPFVTSGLRLGTPAVTTRGFKEAQMEELAALISDVLNNIGNENIKQKVAEGVKDLCGRFPLYEEGAMEA